MYRYSGNYVQVQGYQYCWYRGSTTVGKYQYTPHQTSSTQFVNSTVHNTEIQRYTIYELSCTHHCILLYTILVCWSTQFVSPLLKLINSGAAGQENL